MRDRRHRARLTVAVNETVAPGFAVALEFRSFLLGF
jgi:hypothetical protein